MKDRCAPRHEMIVARSHLQRASRARIRDLMARGGVRFLSECPGSPQPADGTPGLPRRHKSAASRAFEFPPGSAIRRAGLPHISEEPCAKAAPHSCGPRTSSPKSTDSLLATAQPEPGGESAYRLAGPPADR